MESSPSGPPQPAWPPIADHWRRGLVYQIYPRSFADSDANGVGDLAGIVAHLDHLGGDAPGALGVDAIWLSPIYPSPGVDLGYDVSDYTGVDPLLGSLADFAQLVEGAHRRSIRVILDLVFNHTSDHHPWFVASRADRAGPHADWYIWRDSPGRNALGRRRLPNNWRSFFGGPAWTWNESRQQFYLHTFLPEQPDLNWREPAVRAALLDVIRTWLERGVDGFRFDVFNAFFKHPDLPSNPRRIGGRRAYSWQEHRYDKNQPELADLLVEIRAMIDEQPGRMTVGELFDGPPTLAARYAAPGHLVFDFSLMDQPWDARAFARAIASREVVFGSTGWPTVVLSNHDRSRHASRYDRSAKGDARARVAATLLLTLRGTPFLYYGEELGLRDVSVPRGEIIDPPARRGGLLSGWWNRDQARAPMPWGPGLNGQFSSVRPWLPMNPDHDTRNVAAQSADPDSILSFYRRLIRLRRRSPALQVGSYRECDVGLPDVLAFIRQSETEQVLVVLGFGNGERALQLPAPPVGMRWRPLLSTHQPLPDWAESERPVLRPLEAVIAAAG